MRISQLEYIIAIEKYGSINMAASQMFISQSQMSQAVKQLEEELGQPIFVRSSKGIRLTSFGMEFLPSARFVVSQINQMKSMGKQLAKSYSLNICSNGFRFPFRIAAKFYEEHMGEISNTYIRHSSRQDMIEMLADHTTEVGFSQIWNFQSSVIKRQMQSSNVVFFPCTVKPLAAVVGPTNPLFQYPGNSIPASELNKYPYLICDYSQFSPNTKAFNMISGLYPSQVMLTSDLGDSLEILHNCSAFTFTADSGQKERSLGEFPGCRSLEIENCRISAQIGWMKHRSVDLSPLTQAFVEKVEEYLQNR